jgi:hypothetical protein
MTEKINFNGSKNTIYDTKKMNFNDIKNTYRRGRSLKPATRDGRWRRLAGVPGARDRPAPLRLGLRQAPPASPVNGRRTGKGAGPNLGPNF